MWDRRVDEEPTGPPPRSVGASLEAVLSRLGADGLGDVARLSASWETVVGTPISQRAIPRDLEDGVLTLEVLDPSWATQLRFLLPEITERINAQPSLPAVEKIVLRTTGKKR